MSNVNLWSRTGPRYQYSGSLSTLSLLTTGSAWSDLRVPSEINNELFVFKFKYIYSCHYWITDRPRRFWKQGWSRWKDTQFWCHTEVSVHILLLLLRTTILTTIIYIWLTDLIGTGSMGEVTKTTRHSSNAAGRMKTTNTIVFNRVHHLQQQCIYRHKDIPSLVLDMWSAMVAQCIWGQSMTTSHTPCRQ